MDDDEGGTDVDGGLDGADSLGTSPQMITLTVSTATGSDALFGVISSTSLLPSSLMGIGCLGSPTTLTICNKEIYVIESLLALFNINRMHSNVQWLIKLHM